MFAYARVQALSALYVLTQCGFGNVEPFGHINLRSAGNV